MSARNSREHAFAVALCAGLAAASFACATAGPGGSGAQQQSARATPAGLQKNTPVVTHDGLQQVQGVFEHEYVKPGASLAGYKKILLDPVGLAYTKGDAPQRKIDPKDFEQMRAIFQEEVGKQLASGGYQIASGPGPDVLRVQAEAVDLKLIPPQFNPDSTDFALTSESAIVVATLRDSESGEILARVAQPEQPGAGDMAISDPFGFWSQIRELFRRWSVLLLQMVEEARHR